MKHSEVECNWSRISPVIDDAMGSLNRRDREALVLKYFLNQSIADVAAALGTAERATQEQVARALERLRRILAKRGVALSAPLIAGAMLANSVQAAPSGFVKTISAVARAGGATADASTLALVRRTLRLMVWTKVELVVIFGAGAALMACIVTLAARSF
jgi:hypothetical protein